MKRQQIIEKIEKSFDATETILVVLLVVGMFLLTKVVAYSQYIVYAALILLAILYWIMQLHNFSKETPTLTKYTYKISFNGFILGLFSLLSKLTFDTQINSKPLIIGTLIVLTISLCLNIIAKIKQQSPQRSTQNIVRTIIFLLLTTWVYNL